jgi:hypothetical protein
VSSLRFAWVEMLRAREPSKTAKHSGQLPHERPGMLKLQHPPSWCFSHVNPHLQTVTW